MVFSAEKGNWNRAQGFVVVERELMFKVENFSMLEGIVSLIATYYTFYISYPKSLPAQSFLLFVQDVLLEDSDITCKRSSKYMSLVNSIM